MKTCYIDREHRAIADLTDYWGRGLLLTRINVPVQFRGQGVARRLLARVLTDADAEGITLWLEIMPSGGLSFEELKAWYERRGFRQVFPAVWRRDPSRASSSER